MDVPEEFNIEDFVDDEPEDYNERLGLVKSHVRCSSSDLVFENQFFMFVPDFVPDQISKNKLKSSKYA